MNISAEFWIPISPDESMVTQLMILAASLRIHGGRIAEKSKIMALVHPDCDAAPIQMRKFQLDALGIEVLWVEKQDYIRYGHIAGAVGRLKQRFSSDIVVLMDDDTLVAGSLDEVIETCYRNQQFLGLPTNTPPPYWESSETSKEIWTRLFTEAGLEEPVYCCEHSGWNKLFFNEKDRYCPPYFNFGFVLAPASIVSQIGKVVFSEVDNVNRIYPQAKYFAAQFAMAMAINRLSIEFGILDLKYNFPLTHKPFLEQSDQYLKDVRVFHYLGDWEGDLKRPRDFASLSAVGAFIERCENNDKLSIFVNALKPAYSRVLFPWLNDGYNIIDKIISSTGNPGNQILEEFVNGVRDLRDENIKMQTVIDQERLKIEAITKDLKIKIDQLSQDRDDLNRKLDALNAELRALRGSLSWRMTAPVRSAGKILKKLGLWHD